MPVDRTTDQTATVWSATFVPSKSPIAGYGEDGYSVAWIDTPDGRLQVLVSGARPEPGTSGRLVQKTLGENTITFFEADQA